MFHCVRVFLLSLILIDQQICIIVFVRAFLWSSKKCPGRIQKSRPVYHSTVWNGPSTWQKPPRACLRAWPCAVLIFLSFVSAFVCCPLSMGNGWVGLPEFWEKKKRQPVKSSGLESRLILNYRLSKFETDDWESERTDRGARAVGLGHWKYTIGLRPTGLLPWRNRLGIAQHLKLHFHFRYSSFCVFPCANYFISRTEVLG